MRRIKLVEGGPDPVATALTLSPSLLIIDLEPMLLAWDEPDDRAAAAIAFLLDRVGDRSPVLVLTNSRRAVPAHLAEQFRNRANKPWRLPLGIVDTGRVVVIGDTILTDGLLAWRLGATFVSVDRPSRTPWWPRLQGLLDGLWRRVLFY